MTFKVNVPLAVMVVGGSQTPLSSFPSAPDVVQPALLAYTIQEAKEPFHIRGILATKAVMVVELVSSVVHFNSIEALCTVSLELKFMGKRSNKREASSASSESVPVEEVLNAVFGKPSAICVSAWTAWLETVRETAFTSSNSLQPWRV